MGARTWHALENQRIRQLWRTAPRDVIERAIPGRKWDAISRQAHRLQCGSRNDRKWDKDGGPVHPMIAALRATRRRLGIKREDLSEQLGLHRAIVSHWERGVQVPSWANMHAWAKALGMKITAVEVVGSLANIPIRRAS